MFKYLNINPEGEITGDCVIRAIALALDVDYFHILDALVKNSHYFNCDTLVKACYSEMLDSLGFERLSGNGFTVKEISDSFPDDKLVIRIEGHLTCSLYGTIYDIWNPSDEVVDEFWIVR